MLPTQRYFYYFLAYTYLLFHFGTAQGQEPNSSDATLTVYEVTGDITDAYVRINNNVQRVPWTIARRHLVIGKDRLNVLIGQKPTPLIGTQFEMIVEGTKRPLYVQASLLTKIDPYSEKEMQAFVMERAALKKKLRHIEDEIMIRDQMVIAPATATVPRIIQFHRNPDLTQSWLAIQESKATSDQQVKDGKPAISEPYFTEALLWTSLGNHEDALLNFIVANKIAALADQKINDNLEYYREIVQYLEDYTKTPRSEKEAANGTDRRAATEMFSSGLSAFRQNKFKEGARFFTESLLLQPTKATSWYYRALCFKHLKKELRAQHDAVIGVSLERKAQSKSVYWTLSAAQGPERIWLENFRHRKNIPVLARDIK